MTDTGTQTISQRMGYVRWRICALLFFATTINYIDRQILSILAPDLKVLFDWDNEEYNRITISFQVAYSIGLLATGWFLDRFGTRLGYALAVVIWSIAGMGHSLASSLGQFAIARFTLGVAEGANFPAAIKTVAEWFPKRERAFAAGILNAGTNIGAVVTPLIVPPLVAAFGWRAAFIITGSLGFIWLVFWMIMYAPPERHPKLSASELSHIRSDPPDPPLKIRWIQLIPHRQTWAFAAAKFMTDPVWWFFLWWLGIFFNERFGLQLIHLSWPLFTIYLFADVGSIGGGWLSGALIRRGWTTNLGRKTTLLLCAVCALPVTYAAITDNKWVAVAFIGLALAGHQGWSSNLYTIVSDMFPRRAVGSVIGFGGMAGSLGVLLSMLFIGPWLKERSDYRPIFLVGSVLYLIAFVIVQALVPRLAPAKLTGEPETDQSA